jgi:V8-like Glu-specific endopeptidase
MRHLVLVIGLSLLASVATSAQARFVIRRENVLAKSGTVQKRDLPLPVCGPATTATVRQAVSNDAGNERVRLEFAGDIPADGWSVEFVSNDTDERWAMGAAAVVERQKSWLESAASPGNLALWTGAVRGGGKSVIVKRERADAQCPTVRITGLIIDTIQSSPSSINKPDDLKPYLDQKNQWPTGMADWASAIARIRYVSDDDGLGYFCTGFLVTPRLMLTNEHCLSSEREAQSAELDFDYDRESAHAQTVRVKTLVRASVGLDYALVELESATKRTPLTMAAIGLAKSAGDKPPTLVIVQHPSGKIKHASIVDCITLVVDVPGLTSSPTDFEHRCDTEGGSSGSPVHQLPSGFVVGLHHWGKPQEGAGENQAVKIVDVLNDLASQLPQLPARHAHLTAEIKSFIDGALARK